MGECILLTTLSILVFWRQSHKSSDTGRLHITALTRSCYYHLRQLRVVSCSLSSSSTSTLVHAFIANRLDYCSSLYCGLPQVRLQPLNGVLRAAARMIGGVPRFSHITDYMRDVLYWLPVQNLLYCLALCSWKCTFLSSAVIYSDFSLLWLPISPLGLQGGTL